MWLLVSIHAPVKVRPVEQALSLIMIGFNSRTREGATMSIKGDISITGFNSRTREGATLCPANNCRCAGFNSRTREGATVCGYGYGDGGQFQFTHP